MIKCKHQTKGGT